MYVFERPTDPVQRRCLARTTPGADDAHRTRCTLVSAHRQRYVSGSVQGFYARQDGASSPDPNGGNHGSAGGWYPSFMSQNVWYWIVTPSSETEITPKSGASCAGANDFQFQAGQGGGAW